MNVLISGSHGLIGRALSRALAVDGHTVVTLERGRAPLSDRSVRWDPAAGRIDDDALASLGPYDAVVHLAGAGIGERRWSPARKAEIRESRVASTDLLARSLAASPVRPPVLVSASAVGIYGDRGDEPLDESSPPGSGFLAEVCRAWEAATAPAADAGIRVVHLRSGVVLDPSGGALAKQLPLFRAGLGGRLGSGRQVVSWITLEDEVRAIRHAISDPGLSGPVNATAPSPVTNAELTRVLARVLHRPAVLPVPAVALSAVLGGELARELLLAGQRVLPAALEASGFAFSHPELEPALRSLLAAP